MIILLTYLAGFAWSAPRFTRAIALSDTDHPDGEDWLLGAAVGILAAALWPLVCVGLIVVHFAKVGQS